MKKLLTFASLIAMALIAGCGGAELLNAPEIVGVVADSNSVTLTWAPDTAVENSTDFDGYNVYVATSESTLLVESGEDLSPINSTPIDANTYTVTGLSMDTIYFFQVRTLNTDAKVGSYNADVPTVQISPRPAFVIGKIKLELSASGVPPLDEDSCAILFETGEILNEVNNEFPNADAFADKPDSVTAQLVTASARPNGRSTLIVLLDSTYTWDSWDFSGVSFGTSDRGDMVAGNLLLCKTTEGNYVKVYVDEVDVTLDFCRITYAYQNIPDYPYLSP